MEIFKKAAKLKLRFATIHGPLSAEQLWDLSLTALTQAIREARKGLENNEDSELDFLDDTKKPDEVLELRFAILKDVYLTKKKEMEDTRTAAETKAHNQKILSIIQSKKEGALNEMPIEELEKLLK